MNARSRLRHEAASENEAATPAQSRGTMPGPSTPEDLLQRDRAATPVPPTVTLRLAESLRNLPAPRPVSWWRRLFRRS